MKKFIGAICSAAAGIFTFIWLCLDWCIAGPKGGKMKFSGWDLIANRYSDEDGTVKNFFTKHMELKGYTLTRIFAIIMLIVACLLIAAAVVMLLKNLNILKVKLNLSFINNILLAVLVVAIVVTIIGLLVMRADMLDQFSKMPSFKCYGGAGVYLQAITGAAACACGWLLARKDA